MKGKDMAKSNVEDAQACARMKGARMVDAAASRARMGMAKMHAALMSARAKAASEEGQGTTEYAILVGVLVVIAIVAITLFKPKIEELWGAIADGINGL